MATAIMIARHKAGFLDPKWAIIDVVVIGLFLVTHH